MLAKIRAKWVKPLLESDLYQEAKVELQLTEREDDVQTRIHRYNQTGGETGPEIPRDKPIEEIFDEASGQLLILGEPGTGKSTKLVELARSLLDRAADAPASNKGNNTSDSGAAASQPIPVILNLSSWTKEQAGLGKRIQSELVDRYGVSRPRAQQWVEGEYIVPLLDGLDEVAADKRAACVEAINICRRERGLQPMAVCCRLEEYRKLPAPLDLAGAVAVEPLHRDEVETYFDKHGSKLVRVRQALRDDPGLWDLMNTPLMLTVLFLASGVEGDEEQNEADPRRRLYLRFVRRMFSGPRTRRFGEKKALRWLGWLAAQLAKRGQIPFSLEDLGHQWLPSSRAQLAASLIFWLVVGLGFGLVFGLGGGLVVWLVVALVVALVVEDPSFDPVDAIGIDWHRLPDALLKWGLGSGLMVALVVALVVGLGSGLVGELGGGLIGGLGGGLVVWLGGALAITLAVAMVVGLLIFIGMGGEGEGLGSRLGAGLFGGLFLGLITGFVLSVTFGVFGLAFALVFGLFGELGGLVGGLVGGVVFGLVVGLGVGLGQILRPAAVSERSAANEGTSRSLRYALRISSAGVVLAIAMAWLLSVLRGGTEGAISDAVKAAFAFTPALVASAAVLLAQIKGGFFVLSHWAVRAQLQRFDLAPRRYVKFLDEAADMLFLRKTGGAYQFFHVTFRDFVAETYGAEWLTKAPTTPESEQTAAAN